MTTAPLVSVVMPVFNGEAYLAEALRSALAQTWQKLELIVIDDGSTDGSRDIVQVIAGGARTVRYLRQENAGVSAARNLGISSARGSFVAFLDQDDRWAPQALEQHLDYHRQHPDTGYTLAQQVCFLEGASSPPSWFRLQHLDVPHTGYLPGTLFVRREVFEQVGVFDTRYPISSDADWFARARDHNIPMSILPQTLLYRRIHPGNQSRHSRQIQGELTQLLAASIKRKRGLRE